MNHFKKTVATLLAATMCVSMLTACTKANCKAAAAISFSTVNGRHRLKYKLGSVVVMNISYKVTSEETSVTPVKAVLAIQNVKNIEAKYKDGQTITCNSNKNVTTYKLTADASEKAEMQECVIKFMPVAAGNAEVKLVYDDHVDSSYDVTRTIEFDADPVDDFTDEYSVEYDDGNMIYIFG